METETFRKLLHRRQFLLSSVMTDRHPGWKAIRTRNGLFINSHPDLAVTQVGNPENELILLGHILDPEHPEWNNTEILLDLLGADDLFRRTSGCAGRFVLIASGRGRSLLFGDPAGLRSVYYTDPRREPFYCASQPGLIAGLIHLRHSDTATREFLESGYFRRTKEYWWPAGVSLYDGIHHLPPNHCLDFAKGERLRFWPTEPLRRIGLDEGVGRAAILLEKIMVCAASRFDLAMPITAGLDSRTLLAAAREIRDQVHFYTLLYWGLDHESPDVDIPRRLLSHLGLAHHVIGCSSPMDPCFRRLYTRNVDLAHESWGDIAFGLNRGYPEGRVCVKGNVSEIARCFYYPNDYPKRIDGEVLGSLAGMDRNRFAVRHFDNWLREARPVSDAAQLDILDLFYWEHRMGSWQAMSQLEWDIVQEATTPFNCRDLLTILLGVAVKYRRPPQYSLYRRIIRDLWPEVLREPINPRFLKSIRPFLIRTYRKIGFSRSIG